MAGEAIIMLQARRAARVHCIRTRSCHNHATQSLARHQRSNPELEPHASNKLAAGLGSSRRGELSVCAALDCRE
jgi:hypothetical protein